MDPNNYNPIGKKCAHCKEIICADNHSVIVPIIHEVYPEQDMVRYYHFACRLEMFWEDFKKAFFKNISRPGLRRELIRSHRIPMNLLMML